MIKSKNRNKEKSVLDKKPKFIAKVATEKPKKPVKIAKVTTKKKPKKKST